jgi:protein-disulfide isomerase
MFALLAFAACSNSASLPIQGQARPQTQEDDPSAVVAKVRGESITLGEVDKPIVGELRAQKQAHREKLFELRAHALERMIAERLIDEEAKKRGITSEELLEQEVVSKVAAPTQEEVRAFYDERQGQGMPGLPPFEQVAGQIRDFLGQERARDATQAFFDRLHEGAQVEILMEAPEPPRLDVEAKGPSKGPANAPVTIVEFSDFECPYCSRANETLARVEEAYAGKVRIVFRDYPLSFHSNAQKAAEAGQCAHDQGKFWEMHDKMFANQRALEVENLKLYAQDLGLDSKAFDACLDGGSKAEVVKENFEAGLDLGVRGTPAFFVNGKMIAGALPFEEFQKIIDQELGQGAKTASE